jgi:broad specificity phosphatase PhoE
MSDFERFPSDRGEAPAYLSRYNERRREQAVQSAAALADPAGPVSANERSRAAHSSAAAAQTDSSVAPYVRTALAKAAERALREATVDDAPPGTNAAYAAVTVTPREIVPPPAFRSRLAGTVDVRLIRHGETQGYSSDGGLTPLGRWQAHRKGQDLARGIAAGSRVKFVHAPTARAGETASALFEGVLQAMARYGIDATLDGPAADPWFRNFQVWCDGVAQDPTQAFNRYASVLEGYERSKTGDRPGWIVEMDRFWSTQAAGGDPIAIWLSQPLQYFEPAALVVRRFWTGITAALAGPEKPDRLFVATHSGPIRAVAAAAVGHDPGEPYNIEDVRIRVYADLQHAIVTYRGRGVEIEIPTTTVPPWCA